MRFVAAAYGAVLKGMALVAGLLMVAMMAMIVADVALRTSGFASSGHLFTFTEYFLLIVALLGAPWLVREKGHIYIELVVSSVSERARRRLVRAVLVLCVLISAILAWYAGAVTVQDFVDNEKDVRSLDMPRWMVMGFMPLAFGMMTVEFLRLLVRGESPYGELLAPPGSKPE